MLTIYNTLSRTKEPFIPLRGKKVNMFVCGPTVYDFIHIGNARTYVAFDIIVRYLRQRGFDVFYLQNITDVDDKIIARAKEEGMEASLIAKRYENAFYEDVERLNIRSVTKFAPATEYIFDIVAQVQRLEGTGHVYLIDGDGYYFDLKTFPQYGKLSGRTTEDAEDGVSRIDQSSNKRNRGDFCVWKFSKPGEPSWKTKLGEGRPGWHIEDTAITETHFGPQYDFHGSARDLIFPHHEAEIAQMESISGKEPLARYWAHTGFLSVNGKKMSKSIGNFVTVRDFLVENSPETFRMMVAGVHYRSPLDFSKQAVAQAEELVRRLREFVLRVKEAETGDIAGNAAREQKISPLLKKAENEFYESMDDDFNTPKALAALLSLVRTVNPLLKPDTLSNKTSIEIMEFLHSVDAVFGIGLVQETHSVSPREVMELAELREAARKAKNWKESDRLRDEILKLGYSVDDTPKGPRVRKLDNE